MRTWIGGGAAFVLAALLACGSALPRPRYTGQPSSALVEVAYPAPPARVEIVPERSAPGAVWINGEWQWQGRRWSWKPGAWMVPEEGALYAPWVAVRGRDGRLFYAPGTWRDAQGKEMAPPTPVRPARARGGTVVNPEGETEPTGADVEHDAGPTDGERRGGRGSAGASVEGDGGAPAAAEGDGGAEVR